ncbi:MAG: PAS domain-containing protein [Duodenibacillus sp.]|nr:PAS domain-containing protein [Duodenibacillus sp.]
MNAPPAIPDLLKPYAAIADFIARAFGPGVEVVLHDLSQPERSVVYVANGTVTDRRPGQPFRHIISGALKASGQGSDIITDFWFDWGDKRIRSSTLLIRGPSGGVDGAVCINQDATRITRAIEDLSALVPGFSAQKAEPSLPRLQPTKPDDTVLNMVYGVIDRIVGRRPARGFSRERRLELLSFMQQRNVFLMKGAVEYVAGKLGVSRVTVYSDLDALKNPRPARKTATTTETP